MMKASIVTRAAVSCPVCRFEQLRELRRLPAEIDGHVLTTCVCVRCGAQFVYEEDRTGKPVKR
jgi:ribosomal protein L40E